MNTTQWPNLSQNNNNFSKNCVKMEEEPTTTQSQTITTPNLLAKQKAQFTLTIRQTEQINKILEYIEKNFDAERAVSPSF